MIWFCFVGWFFPLFVYSYYNPWTSQVFDMITGVNIYHFTMYQTSTLCEWASELSLGAFPWSVPLMCPCLVAALRPPHPATAPSALQSTVDICLDHIMWTKTHCAMWNLYKKIGFSLNSWFLQYSEMPEDPYSVIRSPEKFNQNDNRYVIEKQPRRVSLIYKFNYSLENK